MTGWENAQKFRISATVQQHLKPSLWSKPQLGRYISNGEASFSHDHNKVDIGVCIRDDQGGTLFLLKQNGLTLLWKLILVILSTVAALFWML